MKKILVVALLILVAAASIANIVEFFEKIPPVVKFGVGAGIVLCGLSWACLWLFEPIVIVGEFDFAPSSLGQFIFMHPKIWYSNDDDVINMALNHEYVHFTQQAFWGPVFHLAYPLFCLYSNLKDGNRWESNPFEQEAIAIQNTKKPKWEPALVIKFD